MTSDRRVRTQAIGAARRIVVKVGSQLLADSPAGRPAAIADDVAELQQKGYEVVVVSSGAIALGARVLGYASRPTDLPRLQAAAAVGQNRLLQHWEHAFAAHGMRIGQLLLTHDDLADRRRFLNARHALRALFQAGAVPLINENDTVAVDEIKWGDNDMLAALVCNLVAADALVILTDVDGLHSAPPDAGGVRVPLVSDADKEAVPIAGGVSPGRAGSGGMSSKVQAAKAAGRHGVCTLVVQGSNPGVVARALRGDDVGTIFLPSAKHPPGRAHWLTYTPVPTGRLVIADDARDGIVGAGAGLLPSGITEVLGTFGRGDIVSLVTPQKAEFARGLVGYSSDELGRLVGQLSADIERILGYKYLDEVIHADDLIVT